MKTNPGRKELRKMQRSVNRKGNSRGRYNANHDTINGKSSFRLSIGQRRSRAFFGPTAPVIGR